jgi:hypothetical protein
MKPEQKGLLLALALGATLPGCVGMGEKPADSAPPVAAAPAATPTAVAAAAPDPTGPTLPTSQNPPPKAVATVPGATGTTP